MGDYFNATELWLENNNPLIDSRERIGARIYAKRPVDSV